MGGFYLGLARPLFAVAIGAQLGACALVPQPRDEAWVRVGSGPVRAHRAEHYAALYVPYAMMSSLAYTRPEKRDPDLCPDPALLDKVNDARAIEWVNALQARKWHCVFGLSERQPCPRRYPDCRRVDGPDLLVWRRNNPFCSEIVIAYRGLNLMDPSDWPNLRWAVKFPTRFDEHEQMQWQIDGIVGRSGCRSLARIIAVGHSLGGGYAEEAAYANGKIRYVYTFNAFPVIGLVDSDPLARMHNKKGLGIDHAYEAGEILAIPRLLLSGPDCNPRVRTVQFNLIPLGLPIEEHRIDTLTLHMRELASRPGANAKSAMGYRSAAQCMEAVAGVKS